MTSKKQIHFEYLEPPKSLGVVVMLFYKRKKDNVTQYIGSSLLDLSQCSESTYEMPIRDCSVRPPVRLGFATLTIHEKPFLAQHLDIQSPDIARRGFDAAEANLNYIQGFGARGLPPVGGPGLFQIHSPYYVNHMGITLPSGAFCLIPTCISSEDMPKAIQSHEQRFQICLCRNNISALQFQQHVSNLLDYGLKAKHVKCLCVLADTLTLHTRVNIEYTPDVIHTKQPRGTERWEVPREPTVNGKQLSFVGDCEDFAREVYQHAKEIMTWVEPSVDGTPLQALSALLHLYVPTIEQGAVDKNAVSEEQRRIHPHTLFRNHIWAALHPRESFRVKVDGTAKCNVKQLYERWPLQKCEKRCLPVLFLEGTGDVFPVTGRTPDFIKRMQHTKICLEHKWPDLCCLTTPRIYLQFANSFKDSPFYKYAIACMTDVFAKQGILDFTYVSGKRYGVDITDWIRGKYKLRPSCIHKEKTMQMIHRVLTLERPIQPLLTTSSIITSPPQDESYMIRYGQDTPLTCVPEGAFLGEYKIHDKTWYEMYIRI